MNLFPKREVPVDMDQLEHEVTEQLSSVPERKRYAPPSERYTPLQTIAHAITKLTWTDAEKMGEAIKAKIQDKTTNADLTSAIQEWAKDWESFNDV